MPVPSDAHPLVELRGVAKTYGRGEVAVHALKATDLRVYPGEVVGLLGPSGSGKTTLLNLVGCIVEPTEGSLSLDGQTVYDGGWRCADLRRLRLEKIGFIFQFHNLLPFLTAGENVAVVLDLAGYSGAAARDRARDLLDYLEVGHRFGTLPSRLSGGEAQRVAIARALANRPRIILADEPTAALDSQRAGIVLDLLRKVAVEQQAAILVVSHDEKIFDRFDRRIVLRDGRVVEYDEPAHGPAEA
ncbi:ABC transporter ATP-binding protein [Azospirillum rugosum]|uniref:ABC transport system ATP-binding protein n=1 Tax=Azospirillum rugosum TaxID=416170 RepID=A0ABS4SPK4_9PROT|nr:ABC transporter ATP-binding protein [Azospirillum rugosum]MBP2293320.1 putative ABC transport system ATP-binding protein [Azospirillum rugosum]